MSISLKLNISVCHNEGLNINKTACVFLFSLFSCVCVCLSVCLSVCVFKQPQPTKSMTRKFATSMFADVFTALPNYFRSNLSFIRVFVVVVFRDVYVYSDYSVMYKMWLKVGAIVNLLP